MRVVFISSMDTAPWGGSEALWSAAALRMAGQGHHVGASIAHWPQPSVNVLAMQKAGVDVFQRKKAPLPRLHRRILSRLTRHKPTPPGQTWMDEQNPDLVVISQGRNVDGFDFMEKCRRKGRAFAVIVQCNTETMWPQDEIVAPVAQAYRAAQKVFCVSRHNLQLLEAQLGESLPQGEVVWNPTNLPGEINCPWPKDDGVWRVANVARFDIGPKGHDVFLGALAQSRWKDRPIEVNFYGTGPYEKSVRRLAERYGLGMVRFRGHVDDVQQIWRENHLLALPSRWEGLPLALVEAMRCGRPALVTDVGGNAEVCIDDRTGFVVPAPTVALWDAGFERAWQRRSDWQRMGEVAQGHIKSLLPADPIGDFCQRLLDLHAHRPHHE